MSRPEFKGGDTAIALLELVALLNDILVDLAQRCRSHPRVSSAVRGTDICKYGERLTVEVFLDVETKAGQSYTYWIELWWENPSWNVDASLRRNDKNGQEKILDYLSGQFEILTSIHAEVEKLATRIGSAALDFDAPPLSS